MFENEYSEWRRNRRRLLHKQHAKTEHLWKIQIYVFYILALVVIPIFFLANAIVLGVEWYESVYTDTSPCDNAIRSLIGYATIYGVLLLWLIGYAILNTQCCRMRLYHSGTCGDYFSDIYEALGVGLVVIIAVYNLYGSYIGTERSFIQTCETLSSGVHGILITDIVVTHIIFDVILVALIPIGIRKYQWL